MKESGRMKAVGVSAALLTAFGGMALGGVSDQACPRVSLESLLDEMSDPDANTYLDPVPWRGRLWSSYDRTLGNEDWSNYLRDETNADGRVEHVMMDAKGPGALVRLWTANGRDAYLRFYFDGASVPLFEGVGTNLIGGHVICPAPLSAALSPQAPLHHQAQNLYLPLAYAKSLKITVVTPNEDKRFWYNAEVREYAAGTPVETVSGEVLGRARNRIEDVCAKLLSEPGDASSGRRFTGTSLELKGPATIRSLALEAKGADERKIRVKMSFDGVETVDVSLAQLKGLGGTALSMPFRRTCRIETSANVSGHVAAAPYRWDGKRSLYFHAKGLDFPKLPTRKGAADHHDVNWVKLTGRGRLVGNALVVGNDYLPPEKKGTWWGEGDEKIRVDGEGFPSYFGTGTEDFFGYAWGEATPYDHPFLKMPESDRNVFRLRRLDSIPFCRSLKLDVEIWHNHTEPTVVDYAPATFWYAERDASGRTAAVGPFRTGERVLFYGDSITHGGKYVCYLQLFENLRHPGSGVRLLNGGRSGGTARTGLVNFDRELKASRPDRAFVMFGMNDIGAANREKALEDYRTNMSNLVSRFAAAGFKPVLMTPTPYDQYNEKAGVSTPTRNEGLAAAAEIVRRTAEGHGLETVDFHAPMTKLFRESAEDFVFCGDRVHPGNEGHLYMAALVLDAMGASPEVDGVTLEARAGEGRVAFDYAPRALPLPRMPEYETVEAFYPLTERLNREIIRIGGLKPGRYTLAFDGRAVGDYSDEDLAKGVNVALLDTPNQRRAQALVPVMRTLQAELAQYRNVILVTRMIEDAKVDPSDFAAADAWLDKWLEGERAKPWYKGVKAWADGYRAGRGRIAETEAEIESLYAQLAAVRPVSSHVTVTRIATLSPVAAEWERKGRPETLEWFSAHQFGRTPIGRTPDETFGPTYVSFPELGIRIDISCHLPKGASAEHPVPVFVFGDHVDIPSTPDFQRGVYKGLPIGEITSRGYAFVRWNFNDVCPNASGYNKLGKWPLGVIAKLATGDEKATNVVRRADSWGTIGAWAWGNSRVLDWIESRPGLDARKVAVVGHSRGGKTALWTAAQDTRFAMAVANGSGCGGAGLARERVKHEGSECFKNILGTFPNWFCPAFTEWIDRDAEVTHDADDLIRLIAPRLVYVASGDKDTWACPASEKAAFDAARDIYRAYGAEDRMGYHCHEGPHKLHAEDWRKFMDFADRHFERSH